MSSLFPCIPQPIPYIGGYFSQLSRVAIVVVSGAERQPRLDKVVLARGPKADGATGSNPAGLTAEQIDRVLKHGAYALYEVWMQARCCFALLADNCCKHHL